MPELPEIAHLARSLEPFILGKRVEGVSLRRADVVRNIGQSAAGPRIKPAALLAGERIGGIARHGKELALVAGGRGGGRVVCVHLGMTGQLLHCGHGRRLARRDHVHCVWKLEAGAGRLVFRDPRRFGGLRVFESAEDLLEKRWAGLGPDALRVTTAELRRGLARTRRAVKAALLDQRLVAGVGNIYADEALFRAGIHPLSRSSGLSAEQVRRLAEAIRLILRGALEAGGSTIRDYRDGRGRAGGFAPRHAVYGRAGEPCTRCGRRLRSIAVAQRTTVLCPGCQRQRRAADSADTAGG